MSVCVCVCVCVCGVCVCVCACVCVFVCVVTDDVGNRLITVTVCQVIVYVFTSSHCHHMVVQSLLLLAWRVLTGLVKYT